MRQGLLLSAVLVIATPAMAQTVPVTEETVHVVRSGETLNGIANRAGVTTGGIVEANALKQPYVVKVGQKLTIPREKPTPAQVAIAAKGAEKTAARVTAARLIAGRTPPAKTTTAPSPVLSPETETTHLVAPGETLGSIAVRAKVPRVLIAEANALQPPYAVRLGQRLTIPRTRRHIVNTGDSGFSIAMQYAVPWEQIALANSLDPNAPVRKGQALLIPTLVTPSSTGPKTIVSAAPPPPVKPATAAIATPEAPRFAWPLAGELRRRYATGSDYHDGLDIGAPKGTMVRAAAAGTVKFAGQEKDQFGNLVVLDHGDGWYTAYGFLSRVTVKEGARVAAGERVGLVGDTGKARGDELHFEVRREGKPVDPLSELPKRP